MKHKIYLKKQKKIKFFFFIVIFQGCGWSKNNDPRFKNLNMDIITGPGAYNINKELIPRYKYNVTSSFASTSLKCDLLV